MKKKTETLIFFFKNWFESGFIMRSNILCIYGVVKVPKCEVVGKCELIKNNQKGKQQYKSITILDGDAVAGFRRQYWNSNSTHLIIMLELQTQIQLIY